MILYNEAERYLELSGTPQEMALQKGQAFRNYHNHIIKNILEAPFLPKTLQRMIPKFVCKKYIKKLGRKYLPLHKPVLQNFHNHNLYACLESLAQGFETTTEYMYGLNALEIITSKLAFSLGCSSIAFGSENSATHHPKIAYNHDFPASFESFLYVQKNLPSESGYASLSLSYPTILGCIAGVNEKGLAVSINHAFATDFIDHAAIPITLLLQECLTHCSTVEKAVHLISNAPVPNGSMVTLIDESGNRAAVELSCQHKSVRVVGEHDILYTFNFYQQEEMKAFEIPYEAKFKGIAKWIVKDRKIHEHNMERHKRYLQIIDPHKKYTDQDIYQLLSDHDGTSGKFTTICRHDEVTMNTIASSIIDPFHKTMRVIFGNTCEGTYESYHLNEAREDAA